MNITLITGYFPPDVGSASHLFADIGGELARRGHNVTVLTNYPSYNVDVERLPGRYRRGWHLTETYNGMTVIRTRPLGMPRHIPWLRGLDQVASALMAVVAGLWLSKTRSEILLVYSPPLFYGLTALTLRRLTGARFVLNVQDLFPHQAIDLGLLRNGLLIRLFLRLESLLYRHADQVTVHSPGNKDHVIRHGGSPERVRVAPNVVDTDEIRPGPRENPFRTRNGIPDTAFLASFAGVLGYNQDLDTVIAAAKLLLDQTNILTYIVGDGVEKPRLQQLAKDLPNVRFLPMLNKEEYRELLHASDAGLVTLHAVVRTPVVPSKILSLMAAGRATVASLPLGGDAPALINEAQCGVCVEPENPVELARALRELAADPVRASVFGKNGRAYAENHFTLGACASGYEEIFRTVSKESR